MDAVSLFTANAYVASLQKLATVPVVAQRVLHELASDKSSGGALAELIARDPSLAATVLKHANSAIYGARRQVKDIAQAVVLLGFDQTAQLAMAASVIDLFGDANDEQSNQLWHRRLTVGAAASRLARTIIGQSEAGGVFVAGLLHDVGRSVIQLKDPGFYRTVYASNPNEAVEYETVATTLKCHPGEIGNALARKWSLPEHVAITALFHHDIKAIDEVTMDKTIKPTVWLVMAGKLMARFLDGSTDEATTAKEAEFLATRESIPVELRNRFRPCWADAQSAFKASLDSKAA